MRLVRALLLFLMPVIAAAADDIAVKDYDISVYITKDMIEDYVTTGVYKDPHATDEASKWGSYKEIKQYCYKLSPGLKEIHYYGNSFQYMATNDDQLNLMNEILGT